MISTLEELFDDLKLVFKRKVRLKNNWEENGKFTTHEFFNEINNFSYFVLVQKKIVEETLVGIV